MKKILSLLCVSAFIIVGCSSMKGAMDPVAICKKGCENKKSSCIEEANKAKGGKVKELAKCEAEYQGCLKGCEESGK